MITRLLTLPLALASLIMAVPTISHGQDSNGASEGDGAHIMPDFTTSKPMSEDALMATFKGRTHVGVYSFITRDFTGFAFTETTSEDGSVLHIQGERQDTGSYSISGSVICYDYDDARLVDSCFNIHKQGNCYYHMPVGRLGIPTGRVTARSVLSGEKARCEPGLV